MGADPSLLGKALGPRLRDLQAAIERFGAYSFAPGEPAPPAALGTGEVGPAAREVVLRALRVAGDPAAYAWLARLAGGDGTLEELAGSAGVSRLVAWERVNDLVQVGLVARALDGDRVGLTGAGRILVDLVEEAAEAAAAELEP